jgi:hypothetical protein
LEHELGDHTVEDGTLEVKRLSRLTLTLLTSAERTEVLGGDGDNIREELYRTNKGSSGQINAQASHREIEFVCPLSLHPS